MDQQIAPHIKLSPNDRHSRPKAPCLQLEVELCPLLKYTLCRPAQDDDPRPFVFRWSPFNEGYSQDGFVLLRHTSDGKLEKVPVPDAIQDPVDIVNPGGSIVYCGSLPGRYREQLDPGEMYELVWPGAKIRLWDWGTPNDHVGSQLGANPVQPDLIIPGGASVTFTYEQIESPVFNRRQSTPPVLLSDLVQGAPFLSVELTGPDTIDPKGEHFASCHVRYHGGPTDRPIIFRDHVVWEQRRPYRLENGLWELRESGYPGIFMDDPDITVNVVEEGGFVTLRPGECWSHSWGILDDIDGWESGDTWRY
ncbi:hypothetical protein BDV29DRAFT_198895 [Aspergillus leporis]|uniref:Uncharacterized protein n=1 Tax=Aspergillus leporis TaxID=41062 RepID=A0A5N5WMT9_9EURO|nr:hypothetical protein BDV29DRAFT_198895 [Aspergillus leporis]